MTDAVRGFVQAAGGRRADAFQDAVRLMPRKADVAKENSGRLQALEGTAVSFVASHEVEIRVGPGAGKRGVVHGVEDWEASHLESRESGGGAGSGSGG